MRRLPLVALAGLLCAGAADAQETARLGVDVAVSHAATTEPSIGVTWHLGRRWALRPQVQYSHQEYQLESYSFTVTGVPGGAPSEPEPSPTLTSERWGGGLDVLFYLGRSPDLSPYLLAGLDLLRATDSEGATESKTMGKGWQVGLGLQYGLKDKLAIFGEVGLRHDWADAESGGRYYSSTSTFASRLGMRFYLK